MMIARKTGEERKSMNSDEVKAAIRKCGSQTKAARMLNISRRQIRKILTGVVKVVNPVKTRPCQSTLPVGVSRSVTARSLKDFRELYDKNLIIPRKIRDAIKRLGQNGWAYEIEFVKDAEISQADMGNFREKFSDYVVVLKSKRVWAGSPRLAQTLRSML